jgi:Flp pilus assembly protein TadD
MSDAAAQADEHYYTALDLFAEGRHEEAIAEYRRCLELAPTHSEAMHGLGRAYQDLGRMDEAIAISQRLVELDPDDILAHTSLSIAYQKKGMIPEAEAEANKARILGWKQQLKGSKT